ncbi:HAMP domain-containing sensor histidine kinase [Caldalkalibacillus mannanilyticus]|uniref:HAMP domain-containing sensor histidine kinase n=1 Tax=Caldalkalibacillus mannanilyticus TaxID=1418 RepID=UPI000687D6E4|nr:HAMP domain-containing sensor histidine kinase [Caldalkalibacillus mannanilyticus]
MKIRSWLLLSYLLVMLLPIVFAYGLYILLSQYNQKQALVEYLHIQKQIEKVEQVVKEPELYLIQSQRIYEDKIIPYLPSGAKVVIYDQGGIVLFVGGDEKDHTPILTRVNTRQLYENLFQLQVQHRNYILKKPTLDHGSLIGFYEITVPREEWVDGVNQRTKWMLYGFIPFFILLYGGVWWMLERKLNRPLAALMNRMTAFARNEEGKPIDHRGDDEIGQLISHFQQMEQEVSEAQKRLQSEQQTKELMIASLGHDLKTPLTSIRAFTESLHLNYQITEHQKQEYVSIILEKTDYMKKMVDDLTTYTLLQSADYQIELVNVEGEEFFDMLLSGYEEWLDTRQVCLVKQVAVQGNYNMNETQMIRVLDNLMSNAIRYTPAGKRIWLAALSKGEMLPDWIFSTFHREISSWLESHTLLIVQNEGLGMTKEDQGRCFSLFSSLNLLELLNSVKAQVWD